jgi:hypothetical protein
VCERLDTAVDVTKWAYYVSRTLRWLETLPVPPGEP